MNEHGDESRASSGKVVRKTSLDDEHVELEQQFILRLPETIAGEVEKALKDDQLHDRLKIDLLHDKRHGFVHFDDEVLPGKLFDLPTITETLKTTDGKTFYKTADISQVLICSRDMESPPIENESMMSPRAKRMLDRKYQYPHGLTAPLKNVRKRRFRKTLRKKHIDMPDVEDELKRLFKADYEANSFKWELVPAAGHGQSRKQRKQELTAQHIFGDISSSEEDEEDGDVGARQKRLQSQLSGDDSDENSKLGGDDVS